MKILSMFVSGILAITFSSQANAACKQSEIKGTWITNQAAVRAEEPHAGQCQLNVDKFGNVLDGSYCSFYPMVPIQLPTTGSVKVNKDCSAVVNLSVGNLEGAIQISKNKQVWSGRFSAQEGSVWGTTTGIKK